MNHERQYIYNLAADPDIDYFGAEELVEIEKLGDIDWKCVAKCLLNCKKNDKDR